jgi:hypothetical protein
MRQHTSAYVSARKHTSAYVSIRQHMSAYDSIRQHTSAYVARGADVSVSDCDVAHATPRELNSRLNY